GGLHYAEISVERRRRGQKSQRLGRCLTVARALVSAKEEELLLADRPAKGAAELVALESIVGRREEIACVQRAVAEEFEDVSVELVGSRLRNRIHGRAGVKPITR